MSNGYKNPNYQSEYRANNKEKLKVCRANYYTKNKEKILKRQKQKYEEDKTRKQSYYKQNKAAILKKAKEQYWAKKGEKVPEWSSTEVDKDGNSCQTTTSTQN